MQCALSLLAKWSVILGIHKNIQVVVCVPLNHTSLWGCVIALDIAIPLSSNALFIHQVFAIYALCDSDLDELSHNFWLQLTNIICHTQMSWSVFSDLNATVPAWECAADNAVARQCKGDL